MKHVRGWLTETAAPPAGFFLIAMAAWDRLVVWGRIPPYLAPRPLAVWQAASEHYPALLSATARTAAGALCGLAASLIAGSLVAFLFSQSRLIERSCYPYAIFLQTVPIVAVAPLIVNCFDAGFQSVVIVAFVISVFPIITNVTAGLTRIDPGLLEFFAVHNASRIQVLWKLRLPNAVPFLVAGMKISCGLSVVGAIVGEIFAGYGTNAFGLGYLIRQTTDQLKTAYAFAAVGCSAALGVAIFSLVSLASATILARWHVLDRRGR